MVHACIQILEVDVVDQEWYRLFLPQQPDQMNGLGRRGVLAHIGRNIGIYLVRSDFLLSRLVPLQGARLADGRSEQRLADFAVFPNLFLR